MAIVNEPFSTQPFENGVSRSPPEETSLVSVTGSLLFLGCSMIEQEENGLSGPEYRKIAFQRK